MSDSLIDLNVISEIDFAHPDDRHAGRYAQYIWEVKKYLAALGKPMSTDVVGNKILFTQFPQQKPGFRLFGKSSQNLRLPRGAGDPRPRHLQGTVFAGADGAGSQSRSLKMPLLLPISLPSRKSKAWPNSSAPDPHRLKIAVSKTELSLELAPNGVKLSTIMSTRIFKERL